GTVTMAWPPPGRAMPIRITGPIVSSAATRACPDSAATASARATAFTRLVSAASYRRCRSDQSLAVPPAPALDAAIAVGVIVVGELFSAPDRARGADPDHAVTDVDVAVRAAGMIDEPREVAADPRIDNGPLRELEAPDVAGLHVAPLALE